MQFTQMNLAISSESLELLLDGSSLQGRAHACKQKCLIRKCHLFDHFHSRVLYKIRGSVRFQAVSTPSSVHHLDKVRGMASWAIWPSIAWKRPKGQSQQWISGFRILPVRPIFFHHHPSLIRILFRLQRL